MKILYVADNDDNVYMLKNRLTRAGFTIIVAADGAEGVAMASSEQPDLVLMDLTLPNMDGEEATAHQSRPGHQAHPGDRPYCECDVGRSGEGARGKL